MSIRSEIKDKYREVATVGEIEGLAAVETRLAKLATNRLVLEYAKLDEESKRIRADLDAKLAAVAG